MFFQQILRCLHPRPVPDLKMSNVGLEVGGSATLLLCREGESVHPPPLNKSVPGGQLGSSWCKAPEISVQIAPKMMGKCILNGVFCDVMKKN